MQNFLKNQNHNRHVEKRKLERDERMDVAAVWVQYDKRTMPWIDEV